MDNENYDGEDARPCPFCNTAFSTDADKCLSAALARITALEAQLAELREHVAHSDLLLDAETDVHRQIVILRDNLEIQVNRNSAAETALADKIEELRKLKNGV